MRSAIPIAVAACMLAMPAAPAQAQVEDGRMSPAAASFLRSALDTLQAVTLDAGSLPWSTIRDSAFMLAAGARTTRDTYGAIAWALRHANKHSFLQANRPGVVGELVDGRYGYVHVPSRSGDGIGLADSLQSAVAGLASGGACGWIVDLRGNGGGNMWPMLAGIGPLLGDSLVGSFGVGRAADRWFYNRGLSGILHANGVLDTVTRITVTAVELPRRDAPVAVLIDGGTGSAGEDIAIALRGRLNVRTFGSPSAGYTTINRGLRLPDGANMVVTTGYNADRRGVLYTEQIQPDSMIPGAPPGWPFATDGVGRAAIHWLATQAACRR